MLAVQLLLIAGSHQTSCEKNSYKLLLQVVIQFGVGLASLEINCTNRCYKYDLGGRPAGLMDDNSTHIMRDDVCDDGDVGVCADDEETDVCESFPCQVYTVRRSLIYCTAPYALVTHCHELSTSPDGMQTIKALPS